jgi:hypothetical protein
MFESCCQVENIFLGYIVRLHPSLNKGQSKKFWRQESRLSGSYEFFLYWMHIVLIMHFSTSLYVL